MILQREVIFWTVAVLCVVFADNDIQIKCGEDTVLVKWTVGPELSMNASRLLLGSCYANHFFPLPGGGGQAVFLYPFNACNFRKRIIGDKLIYKNTLAFRPRPKPKPAAMSFLVECIYTREKGLVPPFLNPGFVRVQGHSQLYFHMGILNKNLTGPAQSNSFPLGSFIPVWAYVEQHAHQPLLLLLDECVASDAIELEPTTLVHPIITNHGCLNDGKNGNSKFLPRYESSAVVLYLQAFRFSLEKEIYIHCKLVAWDPNRFDKDRKMCNFNKESERWELLDDPSESDVCHCCDSVCKRRIIRDVDSEPQGLVQNAVLGPLIITEN
ncbi:zona pellucida sperm-binding protein 3-like [Alosa sapidissima]|uniref:zona pellucida sperm-binding protein 3-like n=1 Tax=Alosa sapidissima TaxID=34773 RepID=UPI001C093A45|nr:zona pellucida sperm-binding protein 3-like [Alosa sapidissima]